MIGLDTVVYWFDLLVINENIGLRSSYKDQYVIKSNAVISLKRLFYVRCGECQKINGVAVV